MGRKPEGKAEKLFKKLGKKVDSLLSDVNVSSDQVKEEMGERFEELKKSKDKLKKEFSEFAENNKDQWKKVESGLDKVADELTKAGESFKKAVNDTFDGKKK